MLRFIAATLAELVALAMFATALLFWLGYWQGIIQ